MISLATKHNDPEAKLGWSERIGYGIGQYGINLINAVIGSFLTIYFTNVALLDAGIIATIIAVSKVFDGVSDVIMGRIVDRTKSKMGKGRVWLFRMCIPFAISTVLLFFVPQNFPTMLKYVYVFLMYNLVNTVFFTATFLPYASMVPLMTRNGYERGMLGNLMQIFSTLGNITINTFFAAMLAKFSSSAENIYTQRAFTVTMIIICSVMVVISMICVLCTKERVSEVIERKEGEPEKKENTLEALKALLTNKYWVILTLGQFVVFFVIIFYAVGAVYYAQYVFQDMGQYSWMSNSISVAQFAIMFITPFLMKKINKSTIYTAGMGLLTLGFLGFGVFGTSKAVMIVCNVMKGCGLGMAGGMMIGMAADTLTYGALKTGVSAVGLGNAGLSAAQKLGMGLGTAVLGWILSGSGFDATLDLQGLAQPESVQNAIRFMYNWIPFVLCAVTFIVMLLFYRIERDIARMQAEQSAEQ